MIDTHFNRLFGLLHPMVLSPLNPLSDWRLAAAVSNAGGLGLIHVGDQDPDALQTCFENTGNDAVGWGIDVARLEQNPDVLDQLLGYRPRAVLLYGGDPTPYVGKARAQNVPVICLVDTIAMAHTAIAAGVDILAAHGDGAAAQGSGPRTTLSLLPEVANAIYASHTETLLLSYGGIADARSVAAALIMGADGVMIGTRLWASEESPATADQLSAYLSLSGDDIQCRTTNRLAVGDGVGLIHDAPPVEEILNTLTQKASRLMTHIRRKVVD